MSLFHAFILGAIQGLTEFLPISSSGHLVLAEALLKLPVESLKSFDIAVHFGTLLAILVYFWKDVVDLWRAFWALVFGIYAVIRGKIWGNRPGKSNLVSTERLDEIKKSQQLLGQLVLATIPAIILALTLGDWLDEKFRHPSSVAILMLVVGVLFFVAEYIHTKVKGRKITLREGMIMGLAQCLALIPGVSRSGITISAGLVQGVKREEAARFSFLLGGVAILGATIFAIIAILKKKYSLPATDILIVGIGSSFVFGLVAISFLMKFLKNHTLHIFGVYRVVLAFILIYLMQF